MVKFQIVIWPKEIKIKKKAYFASSFLQFLKCVANAEGFWQKMDL